MGSNFAVGTTLVDHVRCYDTRLVPIIYLPCLSNKRGSLTSSPNTTELAAFWLSTGQFWFLA